jgi:hypothetical protein
MRNHGEKETPASLVQRYEEHARSQRALVRDLQRVQEMLGRLNGAFSCLLADDHFVTLLRAERLDRIPSALLKRTRFKETSQESRIPFEGIGYDADSLLRSKNVSSKALDILDRMNPVRQAEVARLMVAVDCYSAPYAKALISATARSQVNCPRAFPRIPMNSREAGAANREITAIADQLTRLSGINGSDLITLLVSCRYAERLLANQRIRRYLEKKWSAVCKDLGVLAHAAQVTVSFPHPGPSDRRR